jgi:hypothetical protein
MSAFRILLSLIFTVVFVIIFRYLDITYLTPMLVFPEDFCYYHNHTPPTWIRLFYLDGSGHIETEPLLVGDHFVALLWLSFIPGIILAIKTDKWLLKWEEA